MKRMVVYRAGDNEALQWACRFLADTGVRITETPTAEATHLLLPVPSLNGGSVLEGLPKDITVIGGNLTDPDMDGYHKWDLLQDGLYTAKNAAITADCALRVAAQHMRTVFRNCPTLVVGWGRIGKCLAAELKAIGADVTVAARKEADRYILQALGYPTADATQLGDALTRYRLIFNTVPAPVLRAAACRPDCIKIELASRPGIEGSDVIKALGLPGKLAPEASGRLIADTILRFVKKEETL